jgi:5-formyltetrahydrofolate cyclo-ligase
MIGEMLASAPVALRFLHVKQSAKMRLVVMEGIREQKAAARLRQKESLTSLAVEHRETASGAICAALASAQIWADSRAILFYAALKTEIDLSSLIELALGQGKIAALPQWDPEEEKYRAASVENLAAGLGRGLFGALEPLPGAVPIPWKELDLILVPGLAFDLRGVRLGRGKGFYDRMLMAVRGVKCGVAFDGQIVSELPCEPHDVRMDCMITPTRWIDLGRDGT